MPQIIVDAIDSSLSYLCRLSNSYSVVYKVKKEDEIFVLKFGSLNDDWQRAHISHERDILNMASEVKGITHLVHDYGEVGKYIAMLKEYVKGDSLYHLKESITDTGLQTYLENTVRELHSKGIAKIELEPQNIIISPNRSKATIIDLGKSAINRMVDTIFFEDYLKRDLRKLEKELFD